MSTVVLNGFVLAFSLSALAFAYASWRSRFAPVWVKTNPLHRRVSWGLLSAHLLVEVPLPGTSRDVYALATEGPSTQNMVQAVVLGVAAAWSFHLLARGHTPLAAVWAGPAFWISLLTAFYLATTAWSVWPAVTAYRAVEVGAFWVLLLHLFATERWEENLRALLWLAVFTAWATQLFHLDPTRAPGLLGFAYHNVSTLVAAALLLVEVHRASMRPSIGGWVLAAAAALSVLAFGSLATSGALVLAGGVFLLERARSDPRGRDLLLVGVLVTATALAAIVLQPVEGAGDDLVAEIAELTGKEVGHMRSLTGRLPLWAAIARMTADQPMGLGFAGAERGLALGFVRVAEVGWTASHAHNGYLSGWLGAGWPGLLLIPMIFVAVWRHRTRLHPRLRPLVAGLTVLLAINNITANAVGGQFGVPWMVMMALACAPPWVPSLPADRPLEGSSARPSPPRVLGTPR